MNLSVCPRCNDRGFEYLETHSYCMSCNYSPDLDDEYQPPVPKWAIDAEREAEAEYAKKQIRSSEEVAA